MFDCIAGIFVAFLCILGAVSIIKGIALKISAPPKENRRLYAVRLYGENADIELQLVLETLEWDGILSESDAYAVDCGLDDEKREYCKGLCDGSRIRFVDVEQFNGIIEDYCK